MLNTEHVFSDIITELQSKWQLKVGWARLQGAAAAGGGGGSCKLTTRVMCDLSFLLHLPSPTPSCGQEVGKASQTCCFIY